MVGTNIGAGQRDRALRAALDRGGIAAGLTEIIGLSARVPARWLSLFDTDPAMLDTGSRYLHAVGPSTVSSDLGCALLRVEGAGRLLWPLLANLVRLWSAPAGLVGVHWSADVSVVFRALGGGACRRRADHRRGCRDGCLVRPIVWPCRAFSRVKELNADDLGDSSKTSPSADLFLRSGAHRQGANQTFGADSIRSPSISTRKPRRHDIRRASATVGTRGLTMRLLVESDLNPRRHRGRRGDEFRWPRPVRPGDELRTESEVLAVRRRGHVQSGLIKVRTTTLNQHDEAVQIISRISWYGRRPTQRGERRI